MDSTNQFQYIYANLGLYQFHSDWILFAGSLVGGVVFMGGLYILMRVIAIHSSVRDVEKALAKKKKTLGDLILMKDIQTELEKEIEQAILKAAFHS